MMSVPISLICLHKDFFKNFHYFLTWFWIYLIEVISNFRQYSIVVPTQIKPSSSIVLVVHMIRVDDQGPILGLVGASRTVLLTVKLMRGDNSIETISHNVLVGQSQEIKLEVPKHLGIIHNKYFWIYNIFVLQVFPHITLIVSVSLERIYIEWTVYYSSIIFLWVFGVLIMWLMLKCLENSTLLDKL